MWAFVHILGKIARGVCVCVGEPQCRGAGIAFGSKPGEVTASGISTGSRSGDCKFVANLDRGAGNSKWHVYRVDFACALLPVTSTTTTTLMFDRSLGDVGMGVACQDGGAAIALGWHRWARSWHGVSFAF